MLATSPGPSNDKPAFRRQFPGRAIRFGITTLLLALLYSCSQVSVPKPKTNIRLAPAPYFNDRTGIYFPGAIGTLHRHTVVQLEDRTPGLGVALGYRDLNSKLDIFVYDLRAPLIPNGTDSPIVQNSFLDAIANIEKAAAKGLYSNLEIHGTESITIAGQNFLRARMSYGESLVQKDSELLVSGVNGQILKIRIAMTTPTTFNRDQALSYIEENILNSRSRSYGGISNSDFEAIQAALKRIHLNDGLDSGESMAIAQMELITRKLHNRFDPTQATWLEVNDQGVHTIAFAPYRSTNEDTQNAALFQVSPEGSAQFAQTPEI